MSDDPHAIDVTAWVRRASQDPVAYRQRQAIEIILNAIALAAPLNAKLFLKGGILLGLAYESPRQTTDVDLTATFSADEGIDQWMMTLLNSAFPQAAASLGYADLVVRAQSVRRLPSQRIFTTAEFPALKLKIAFAIRGTNEEQALISGMASSVIDVDISFNEPMKHVQVLRLTGGRELLSYGLMEIAVEKYRALLQQKFRNRSRRQDVYDLDLLIRQGMKDKVVLGDLLQTLLEKCAARQIVPYRESLDDEEIKDRAGRDWNTMHLELDDLPEFEGCYRRVSEFYRALPWGHDQKRKTTGVMQ